jgi:hypothetical protein
MPYIRQEAREPLEEFLRPLAASINDEGQLNYVISRLLDEFVNQQGGNYAAHNRAMGVMTCAALEFYRRQTAPYEDVKIEENGDI